MSPMIDLNILFLVFFSACFVCYILRTSHHILENRGKSFFQSRKSSFLISISMFFLWFSWFAMSFYDPINTNLFWIKYLGLIIFVIGSTFIILSHLRIKGHESEKLITTGIYSKIRHPMYLGFILWIIGFPLLMQSIVTFASAILWIPQILYWKISEEKSLKKKYKKYLEYKKKTWF